MIVLTLLAAASFLQVDIPVPPRMPQSRVTGVRAGWTVEPESIHVGDPGILKISVRAPAGTRVVFPQAVDSTAQVEPLDPVVVTQVPNGDGVEWVGKYRFLAWELGLPQIGIQPIVVQQNGEEQEMQIADARVFVMTVLPADTALRKPKPARSIIFLPPITWAWWIAGIAGVFVIISLGYWLQRRTAKPPPRVDPFKEAQRAFGRLLALDLIGAGEPARHVGASADILRAFLATRGNASPLGLTTTELVAGLAEDTAVPLPRVELLLVAADDIKFAGATVDAKTAEALGSEATAVVKLVHTADISRARQLERAPKKRRRTRERV